MRVLTYNLLAGGPDDVQRLQQATLLLRAAQPDVLALNECSLLADRARLRELEQALGMEARLAEAESGFHLALLLRDGAFEQLELLHEGFAHAALAASVRVCGSQLQVIVAHLDPFSASHRQAEAASLLQHKTDTRPTLLLGDLNAISRVDVASAHPEQWPERYRARHLNAYGQIDTCAIDQLEQAGLVDIHAALHKPTQPTRPTPRYARHGQDARPSQRLDYILTSADLARTAKACTPFDHPLAETTSDHYPLNADFHALLHTPAASKNR